MTIHQPANLIISHKDVARGARYVAADELGLIPVPASTDTRLKNNPPSEMTERLIALHKLFME